MLSWTRVQNVVLLLEHYSNLSIIKEIFIFNNNPENNISSLINCGRSIRIIQSTVDLGLYTRFSTAALSENDCILYVDDDIIVQEETIVSLYQEWMRAPYRCHGIIGRSIKGGYSTRNVYGNVKIVLTRCSMTHRDNCIDALRYTKHFKHLNPIPRGNGEDIILSYTAMINSGHMNRVYKLPYEDLLGHRSSHGKNLEAIHQRFPDHYKHRQEVAMLCEKLMIKEIFGSIVITKWIFYIRKALVYCINVLRL